MHAPVVMVFRVLTEAEFERACLDIEAGWADRAVSLNARLVRLERDSYGLISYVLDEDLLDLWAQREATLSKRGAPGRGNPFAKGLRIIFAREPKALSSAQRELISLRLLHAYRHFVPPVFLNCFLGGVTVRPSLNEIAPGFDDWVADRLADMTAGEEWRGSYPKRILDLMERSASVYSDSEQQLGLRQIIDLQEWDRRRDERGNISIGHVTGQPSSTD